MAKYRLGDIAPVKQGIVPDSDQYWLLNLDAVESNTGNILEYVYVDYSQIGASTVSFNQQNVLYSKLRPYLNKVVLPDRAGYATSEMLPLMPNEKVITREYLTFFLRSPHFVEYINGKTSGAKMPRANTADLKAVEMECPPINEQNRIVSQINSILTIIAHRKNELSRLDELIRARFVEMFGDRWANNKNWPQKTLAESADFYNGKAHEQVVDENGEYILVTSRCIASDMTEYRRTNASLFPLKVGDICMVMSDVPNGKALAKCIRVDKEDKYTLNQRICCFRNYELNPIFFFYLLNRHEYLLSYNDGDSQTNLRKNDLLSCPVIYPPMDLQNQFADFVKQVDKSKAVVQKSLDKMQLLFDSLMQQYFG